MISPRHAACLAFYLSLLPACAPEQPTKQAEDTSLPAAATTPSRQSLIALFSQHDAAGEDGKAAAVLQQMILQDPQDYEAIFNLSLNLAKRDRLDEAFDLIQQVPADHPTLGISALGQSADWAQQLKRWQDAVDRYQLILKRDSRVRIAQRQLAQLLNRLGRRHEANRLVQSLCIAGDVTQAELQSLIIESDAVCKPSDWLNESEQAAGAMTAIGPGGQARFLWTQSQFREAAQTLRPWIESGQASPGEIAFFGAIAIEAQQDEWFQWWYELTTDDVKAFPEYWSAIGAYQLSTGDFKAAVNSLAEALQRDPSDIRSTKRMVQAFRSLGDPGMVKAWERRFETLMLTLNASLEVQNAPKPDGTLMLRLATHLESRGNRLEAVMWKWIAAMAMRQPASEFQSLENERTTLLATNRSFPTMDEKRCGIDRSQFTAKQLQFASSLKREELQEHQPLHPTIKNGDSSSRDQSRATIPAAPPRFRDVAHDAGIAHQYRIATKAQKKGFSIYQTFGGGVAVTDGDLDGWPDLYFCQGAADPPNFVAVDSDRLYRNVSTTAAPVFQDVTEVASLQEAAYSLGITAGDWNQDGFPDLVVSNLGQDRLLINQGDGTYRAQGLQEDDTLHRLTTSVAMADISGDHLPDIYLLNYLDDADLARRPSLGTNGFATEALNPLSFKPSRDQWAHNDGQGGWKLADVGIKGQAESTSLGVVIAPLGADHNQVFVANDELANQLWRYDPKSSRFEDQAIIRGCAFGSLGSPAGSMGIAAADFDRSGTCDLLVTNFYRESNHFYLDNGKVFRDLNVRYGIDRVSALQLGFGCQAIDCQNLGTWDLVVVNGHVEDLSYRNEPFAQPTQLLRLIDERYQQAEVVDPSGYFGRPHLGRALAHGDFNRDGRTDLVVTDLLEPAAVLLNESLTDTNWLRLRLVGTRSERDAIGAEIELQTSAGSWTQWVCAGDGYLAKNEAANHFGLGSQAKPHTLVVAWPSGKRQTWSLGDLALGREYLCVEGDTQLFPQTATTAP